MQISTLVERDPKLPQLHYDLANAFRGQHETSHDLEDLEFAICAAQEAVDLATESHPRIGEFSVLLATLVSAKYHLSEIQQSPQDEPSPLEQEYLSKDISRLRQAMKEVPNGHPYRREYLCILGFMLSVRSRLSGDPNDIEAALSYAQDACELAGISDGNESLIKLLDSAIENCESLIARDMSDGPHRAQMLQNLHRFLGGRYEAKGDRRDLNKAVEMAREAIKIIRTDSPERRALVWRFVNMLSLQHGPERKVEYIEEAIRLLEEAVEVTKVGDPMRARRLYELGYGFLTRHKHSNGRPDLEMALTKVEEAVSLGCADKHDHRIFLAELGNLYLVRYKYTYRVNELDVAIRNLRDSEALAENDGIFLGEIYYCLAGCYHARWGRLENSKDLDEAISITRDSLKRLKGHFFHYRGTLESLGKRLINRYLRGGDQRDFDEASASVRKAMELAPKDYSNLSESWQVLGDLYGSRYRWIRDPADLDSAISFYTKAKDIMDQNNPDRAVLLARLGNLHYRRCGLTFQSADLQKSVDLMFDCVRCAASPPLERVSLIRYAIHSLFQFHHHEGILLLKDTLAQEALELLPYACSRELSREDQQYAAQIGSGLAADGCALSVKAGDLEKALQRIESGRGLILGNLINRLDDLAELERKAPQVSQEYKQLRQKAFQPVTEMDGKSLEMLMREREEAYSQLQRCEETIRLIPEFEQFQKPPSVQELRDCAADGPIVIVNVTDIGSDAIIVTESGIDSIPLPAMVTDVPAIMKRALGRYRSGTDETLLLNKRPVGSEISEPYTPHILSWLWYNCVHPILDHLNLLSDCDDAPRVWWIGSGAAASLPFHAAGDFQHQLPRSCLDYITPSYTPTIKALQYAKMRAEKLVLAKKPSLLVVTMESTPSQPRLPGVMQEKSVVERAVNEFCNFTQLEHPTAQDVLDHVRQSQIVHFACHGFSDPTNPSKSHLLLQKTNDSGEIVSDDLTVGSLLDATSQSESWIVYLSACSTAQVTAQNFSDEGLHLASAFQIAGFAHAIGSLWSVEDSVCIEVARLFYKALAASGTDDRKSVVPKALRRAVMEVRAQNSHNPSFWAPFIHYGA